MFEFLNKNVIWKDANLNTSYFASSKNISAKKNSWPKYSKKIEKKNIFETNKTQVNLFVCK